MFSLPQFHHRAHSLHLVFIQIDFGLHFYQPGYLGVSSPFFQNFCVFHQVILKLFDLLLQTDNQVSFLLVLLGRLGYGCHCLTHLLCVPLGVLNESALLQVVFKWLLLSDHFNFKHLYFHFKFVVLFPNLLAHLLDLDRLFVKQFVVVLSEYRLQVIYFTRHWVVLEHALLILLLERGCLHTGRVDFICLVRLKPVGSRKLMIYFILGTEVQSCYCWTFFVALVPFGHLLLHGWTGIRSFFAIDHVDAWVVSCRNHFPGWTDLVELLLICYEMNLRLHLAAELLKLAVVHWLGKHPGL